MTVNEIANEVLADFNRLAQSLRPTDYFLLCGILAAEFGILADDGEGEEDGEID